MDSAQTGFATPATPCSQAAAWLLYAVLLVAPLFHGLVLPWQQSTLQLAVLLIVILLLIDTAITRQPLWQATPFDRPIAALLLLVGISWAMSKSPPDAAEAIPILLTSLAIFYAAIRLLSSRAEERRLVAVLIAGALLVALLSLAIHLWPGLFPFWNYDDAGISLSALSGPFRNYNHLAGRLEMTIPLALALLITRPRRGWHKAGLIGAVLFLGLVHLLTLSRGGWGSLALALTLMTLILLLQTEFRRKRLLLVTFIVATTVLLLVLTGSELFERALTLAEEETWESRGGRIIAWRGTLELIAAYPWLGGGPGTYATLFPAFQPPGISSRYFFAHNDYLQAIADLGLLFIPLLAWLLYTLGKTALKKLQSPSRQTRGFTLGALTGIIAILCHSVVDFNLHIPANAAVFAVLAAIIAARHQTANKANR